MGGTPIPLPPPLDSTLNLFSLVQFYSESKTAVTTLNVLCQACDCGDKFPLWGACLGFELLNVVTSVLEKDEILASCDAENYSVTLDFTSGTNVVVKIS